MELSLFLAQLFGLTLTIVAISSLIRPKLIEGVMRSLKNDDASILLFGYVAVVTGLAIVLSHNIWSSDWRVVITLVGWASLLKGVLYLCAPKMLFDIGDAVYGKPNRMKLAMVLALIAGLWLAAKGFGY